MAALEDTLDDLDGFAWIPGVQHFFQFMQEARQAAATGRLSLDATQTLLSLLGNPNGPDLPQALADLAQDLTNPDTNTALNGLDPDTVKEVQLLGELHAHDTADYTPRDHTNEACARISEAAQHAGGRCQAVTDDERKELSKKVADANKKSINRPR
ncbi:hypothetical protein [Streptomyces violaceus]|uniref:DUF222 domain-containing protein n=1 Tax=Streptomyces violaceus TaxID=1936 RepID=A0ABY9UP77_STRVL|nr:hypothetical protein [Streptomyces janthinus]WND24087.1 hypothetical protein RI060_42980 [Streptomyces janthinus]GGS96290.1 hypothetical protein GCM10010270_80310 [Streptomyces janthinus]